MRADPWRRIVHRATTALGLALLLGVGVGVGAGVTEEASAQMPVMSEKMMTWEPTLYVLFDQLEHAPGVESRPIEFDMISWYGNAHNRVWLRSQGDVATTRREGEAEAQLLYGRLVDPFWDAVVGVRVDRGWGAQSSSRQFLAVGLIGLAPYRFELSPTLFVSTRGEISGRLEAAYDVLITQRLIAEPEVELNLSAQQVPAFGITRGLNDYETGLRLRYEFRREFAPYVGVSRSRRSGEKPGVTAADNRLILGLRLWR